MLSCQELWERKSASVERSDAEKLLHLLSVYNERLHSPCLRASSYQSEVYQLLADYFRKQESPLLTFFTTKQGFIQKFYTVEYILSHLFDILKKRNQ